LTRSVIPAQSNKAPPESRSLTRPRPDLCRRQLKVAHTRGEFLCPGRSFCISTIRLTLCVLL